MAIGTASIGPVTVTRLGMGAAPLGGLFTEVTDEQAFEAVAAAVDRGIRYVDTAPLYGHGLSEIRLGKALRRLGERAAGVAVSTKVGRLLRPGTDPTTIFRGVPPLRPVFDFSHDGVWRSLDESLDRLGRDRVDIVHVHDPDDFGDQAVAEALPALVELREQGVIGAVGAGMNQAAMLARFVREADIDCVLLAGRYTLLDQSGLDELLPLCEERGVAVIAAGVFNSGVLADPTPGATYDYAPASDEVLSRAQRIGQVCRSHGVELAAAAVQFPAAHPAVRAVLVGARSAAEAAEAARLAEVPIPGELWSDLRSQGLLPATVPVPS